MSVRYWPVQWADKLKLRAKIATFHAVTLRWRRTTESSNVLLDGAAGGESGRFCVLDGINA